MSEELKTGTVWYSPAECDDNCTIDDCPYTHKGTWSCGDGEHFNSKEEAESHLEAKEAVNSATDFLKGFHDGLNQITDVSNALRGMASHFYGVGNIHVGDKLVARAEELDKVVSDLEKINSDRINFEFKEATDSHREVLKTVLTITKVLSKKEGS